jgi:hypothetical protein
LLVFTEHKTVTFKGKRGKKETKTGRWCKECKLVIITYIIVRSNSPGASRKDPKLIRTKSLHKAFLIGGNSTCRYHIRQHYEYYSKRCKEEGIEERERCVPPEILKARKSTSKVTMVQSKLNITAGAELAPKQFSREGTLRAVTQFVSCDDQV